MEGHCSTGQSPQWVEMPMEEEEEMFEISSLTPKINLYDGFRHFVVRLSRDFVFFSAFTGELHVRAYWLCSRPITLSTFICSAFLSNMKR